MLHVKNHAVNFKISAAMILSQTRQTVVLCRSPFEASKDEDLKKSSHFLINESEGHGANVSEPV